MRYLGQIEGRKHAEAFVAYLLTKDISTHIEGVQHDQDQWEIWVREEDRMRDALAEFEQFRGDSNNQKYGAAIAEATKILKQRHETKQAAAKNIHRVTPRPNQLLSGGSPPPLTMTLLIICIAASIIHNFGKPGPTNRLGKTIDEQLSFVEERAYRTSREDPAASLKKGEIWRAITPIFLHGDPIHLAMNMMMLFTLGRLTERLEGTPKFALLVLLLAILPNLLQGLSPAWMTGSPRFVGISGVLYGLFGFLWVKSALRPEVGFRIPSQMVVLLVALMFFGFSGTIPHMANLCHLGGFLLGMMFGWVASQKPI